MAMNYTTLIAAKTTAGSIKSWVNYARLDVEQIVDEAQTLIYDSLRVREMRTVWGPALSVGDSTKALPSDFLDPNGQLRDTDNGLYCYLTTPDMLIAERTYTSGVLSSRQPYCWTIFDEALQFDGKFSTARTLILPYYKTPALLVTTTVETNFLTIRYPHLLRQACLVRAFAFMKDWSSSQAELSILTGLIGLANANNDLVYRGSQLQTEA